MKHFYHILIAGMVILPNVYVRAASNNNVIVYFDQPPAQVDQLITNLVTSPPPIIKGSVWHCTDFVKFVASWFHLSRVDVSKRMLGMKKGLVRINPSDGTDEFTRRIAQFHSDSMLEWICRMSDAFEVEFGVRVDSAIVFGLIENKEIAEKVYYIKYHIEESGQKRFVVTRGDNLQDHSDQGGSVHRKKKDSRNHLTDDERSNSVDVQRDSAPEKQIEGIWEGVGDMAPVSTRRGLKGQE